MHDLIERQAAIDAILSVTGNSSVRELYEHVQEHGLSDMWSGGVSAAIDIIIAVPSAQPDLSEYSDKLWKAAYERGKAEAQPDLDEVYAHAETEAEARYHDDIVRCKHCKYNSNMCGNYVNCDIIPQMFGRTVDNFCSRAERRTDEGD